MPSSEGSNPRSARAWTKSLRCEVKLASRKRVRRGLKRKSPSDRTDRDLGAGVIATVQAAIRCRFGQRNPPFDRRLRVDRPDCCGQAETKNEIEGYSSHATLPREREECQWG